MKILLVNTFDIVGGPGRWVYMMHTNFLSKKIDSTYLVDNKFSKDPSIIGYSGKFRNVRSRFKQTIEYLPLLKYPKWKKVIFSTGSAPFGINKFIDDTKPDIVHLNWINRGFISIKSLSKIKQPVVWTLHDMWPFTGGCHYDEECGRYHDRCGTCPILGSKSEEDLSRRVLNEKNRYLNDLNLTVVAPSKWLWKCASESSLFRNKRVENIPVGMDINTFSPVNKMEAREILKLPKDKKLVLFGAMNAVSDKRKGFGYLQDALNKLANKNSNIELVIFGSSENESRDNFNFKCHFLGNINDNKKMSLVYSAADVFVAPSIQDNMPATVMEALACGTPVAAFNIGGMPDMIEHKLCGYLAHPFETSDLANGIEWILSNENIRLGNRARSKMIVEFDISKIADKYFDLYHSIVDKT